MTFRVGNICHIEIAAHDLEKCQAFYSALFGWTFEPLNESYVFFDAGNMTGALDTDLKPSHGGTLLVMACADVDAKLAEVKAAGGKVLKEKTAIPGHNSHYGYFEDLAGNKMGVWAPMPKE
jgi:uncharacterized protein